MYLFAGVLKSNIFLLELIWLKGFFFKGLLEYTELRSFMIISSNYIKREKYLIFDEVFINQAEDTDFPIRIETSNIRKKKINYEIGSYIGSTFGMNNDRRLRSLASLTYFSVKWENKLVNL